MKTVFSVGVNLPGNVGEHVPFVSDRSLLDADIVVFRPTFSGIYESYGESYQGKRCYGEDSSFKLKERIAHWRRELSTATEAGKTVFVLLGEKEEAYVDTGQRSYSGTGRNARTTRHVELCCNYDPLPSSITATSASGHVMILSDKAAVLRDYWTAFGELSVYSVVITSQVTQPLILSKDRKHVLGATVRFKGSSGSYVLLPDIPFAQTPKFLTTTNNGKSCWTQDAIACGHQFLEVLCNIDAALRSETARSPTPTWAKDRVYDLPVERKLKEELLLLEEQRKTLDKKESDLKQRLREETLLKGLLYEQGHPLEAAIIHGLTMLGFKAQPLRESDSEFDAVFESAEGRFIGEAEGKDSKAINIDKLRQLEMNIHEDFARDGVTEVAKAVLFGNAARLQAPSERKEFFTEKCLIAAKRNGCALVRTPDLFLVARYLSDAPDIDFARLCRQAILTSSGQVVQFPRVPVDEGKEEIVTTVP